MFKSSSTLPEHRLQSPPSTTTTTRSAFSLPNICVCFKKHIVSVKDCLFSFFGELQCLTMSNRFIIVAFGWTGPVRPTRATLIIVHLTCAVEAKTEETDMTLCQTLTTQCTSIQGYSKGTFCQKWTDTDRMTPSAVCNSCFSCVFDQVTPYLLLGIMSSISLL